MTVVFTVNIITCELLQSEKIIDNRCTTKRTCGSCIAADTSCSWCKQEHYDLVRCDLKENLLNKNCSSTNVVSPKSIVKTLKSLELSAAGVKSDAYVQLKPQKTRIKIRPHEVVTIPLEFRQAEDYPLDLYYLMDLTYSMRDDKEKLLELSGMLIDNMTKLTTNFRMGFGSFVDKVVLPYANMVPDKLKNPCLDGVVCAPPYGFRNHLKLSKEADRFIQEVKNAEISANLDDAEAGFDAIMQVLECKKEIDWNDKSRKIILFASDSGFHYAGDGKLGGIVRPNDERCHLNEDGYYTMSTLLDYPSISQLIRKVREEKVFLIFAITANQFTPYTKLSEAIAGSYLRELESDSSNVVQLVHELYQKISSEVEMKAEGVPDNVKVTFSSLCPDGKTGSHLCKGLKIGTTVMFNVSFELEDCPKPTDSWSHKITIHPAGINEVLEIQMEMICRCDCELPDQEEVNSPFCSNFGTYECGICDCYDRRFGRQCECNATVIDEDKHLALCIAENSTDICSKRGDCICGICECWPTESTEEEVTGVYCQCDNYSCERDEKQEICGGSSQGKCECGTCDCKPGWSGPACACPTSNGTCIGANDQICSGHGICKCGRCLCDKTDEGRYGGTTCDDCPSCTGKCSEFRHCVECLAWETGEFDPQQCKSNCSSFTYSLVSDLKDDDSKRCLFKDKDDCLFRFTYAFNELNKPIVIVQEEKECAKTANIPIIIAGLIGGIFLIGLLIICFTRLLMYFKDRRAYARFMEDVKNTKWDRQNNPLYKSAVTTFKNPTYSSGKQN